MPDLTRFVFRSGPGPDRNGFITEMDGWDLASFRRNPVILFAHQDRQLPIGRAHTIGIINGQMLGDVEFASHQRAREVQQLVDEGFLLAASVGFVPLDFDFIFEEGHFFPTGIHSRRQELVEISVVPVPADDQALKATTASPGYADAAETSHLITPQTYQARLMNPTPKMGMLNDLTALNQLLRSS